jgi:hypothetical protein
MTVIPLRRPRQLPDTPAFGPCAPSGWRRRIAVPLVLAALLGTALGIRASGVLGPGPADRSLPPLPAVAGVAPGLLRGGEPSDAEILRLRDDYGVRAVVDVDGMDVEETAVTRSLGLRTLQLTVADGRAPTAPDMLRLVRFLRSTVAARPGPGGAGMVYLHDLDGRGPVRIVAAMLQVLRGVPMSEVLDGLRADRARELTAAESLALDEVDRVRRGVGPGRAYAELRAESW